MVKVGRQYSIFRFFCELILFAQASIIFAQPPSALPIGGSTQGLLPSMPTIGMYPQTMGMYPQTMGMYPQTMGMYSQASPQYGRGSNQNLNQSLTNRVQITTNNFQKFIFETTGEYLPMYGQKLFMPHMQGFTSADNLPVTADYVVGPGDQLVIRAWGQVDINLVLFIDRNGAINIPKVGVLQVAGLKASQIEGFVKTAMQRLFKDFELNVSFGRLRSIKVLIVGHVEKPGNYTVSALSTALSALFEAGGPSSVGSMRKIEVRRGNKPISELDLYDLLIEGDNSKDIRLLHGDVIRVLPMGPLVAIKGSVQSPGVYETKEPETVDTIIELSGGLTATASRGRASLERIEDNIGRRIKEIKLNDTGLNSPVKNGDLISIEPISPQFDQVVSLRGHVDFPRRYSWKEGMRLKDLIPDASYLVPRKYWMRVNLLTEKQPLNQSFETDDNATKSKQDQMRAIEMRAIEMRENPTGLVRGLLNEINWQYATITRLNTKTLRNELISFNLGAAIKEDDPEENHILKPGDIVTIYNQKDVPVPKSKRDSLVVLRGEITNPGVYRILPGETLPQLVRRAGGITSDAYLYASVFTREAVKKEQRRRIVESTARVEKEMASATAALQARTISPDVKNLVAAQMQARAKTINMMRATVATGRVTLQLERKAVTVGSLPQIELEDGDVFVVPSKMNEVHIMGEVYNQQSTLWSEDSGVIDTMAAAGGADEICRHETSFFN